jgi:two-component system response regulator FixJ
MQPQPANSPVVAQFVPGDYTVLVVDSDQQVCRELTALLSRAGYRTRSFNSAESVLQAISEHPDHVCVISEIELPDMTGLDLISRLRQENNAAPVVILTRLSDVATAVRAMRDSVSDYLVKPYVERDLINRLKTALIKRREVNG